MSTAAIPAVSPAPLVPARSAPAQAQPSPTPATANPKSAAPTPAAAGTALNAVAAALKEATETSAQTAQEARSGDHQAQRLLAKVAASDAARTGTSRGRTGSIVDTKA
jgi:hypothetical protein